MSPWRLSAGLSLWLLGWAFLAASASAQPQGATEITTREPRLQGNAILCSSHDPMESGCPHRKKSVTLVPAFTKTTTQAPTTRHTTKHTSPHTTKHTTHATNHTTKHPTPPTTTHPIKHTTPPTNHTTKHTTKHPTAPTPKHTTSPTNHTTKHTTKHPRPHTTKHPTPHPTGHHPANHTTHPANHTVAPTTASPRPTQPPFIPVGDYVVQAGSHTCLRVQAGLELHVRYVNKAKQQLWGSFPLQPNRTRVSGQCSNDTASLHLRFPEGFLLFTFRKNETQNKSHLSRVQANLTYRFPQATEASFAADNSSLRTFEAQIGHSYQCRKRTIELSEGFHLDALKEQVQAFGFQGTTFGPAEVCPEQRRSPILPIIVGVVLLILIIIVVVAFALGRWRSHRGYQTI